MGWQGHRLVLLGSHSNTNVTLKPKNREKYRILATRIYLLHTNQSIPLARVQLWPHIVLLQFYSLWSNLVKYRHFGNKLNPIIYLKLYIILKLLWIFYYICQILIAANVPLMKNNLANWLHCPLAVVEPWSSLWKEMKAQSIKFGYCKCLYCFLPIFINTTAYHWADTSLHLSLAVALLSRTKSAPPV